MLESGAVFSSIIGGVVVIIGNHYLEQFKQDWDSRTRKKQRIEKQLDEFYAPLGLLGEKLNYIKELQDDFTKKHSEEQNEINKNMSDYQKNIDISIPPAFGKKKQELVKEYVGFLNNSNEKIKETYLKQLRSLIAEKYSLIDFKDFKKLLPYCYGEDLNAVIKEQPDDNFGLLFSQEIPKAQGKLKPCEYSELIEMHKAKLEEYNNL